jgi:hypothetical protein
MSIKPAFAWPVVRAHDDIAQPIELAQQLLRPFPTDLLPEPLRSFIAEAADSLDSDPSFVALPALAAVASAIGSSRCIRLKKDWREPAIIWTATVGESGTLKTPAIKLATVFHHRRQRDEMKRHIAALAEHADAMKTWKAVPKNKRDDEPATPLPCNHIICSDITVEGLADRLMDNQRGLLVCVDELSGLFARFDRYAKGGGGDIQHYLSMFSGASLKIDRKTGDRKTIYVPHPAVSIAGGIQPGILRRVFSAEYFDCGLPARLLLAMPDTRPAKWSEREIGDGTWNATQRMMDELFAFQGESETDGNHRPMDVILSDDAQERFIDYVNQHAERAGEMTGADAAAWSKLKGYAARFALIFHCVRQAGGESVEPSTADLADVENGIALADWFWGETKKIYGAFSESAEEKERRQLLELVRRLGGKVTARDLQKHCRKFKTSEDAELALISLANANFGSWEIQQTDGRPKHVFCVAASPDFPAVDTVDADGSHKNNRKTPLVSTSTLSTGADNGGAP